MFTRRNLEIFFIIYLIILQVFISIRNIYSNDYGAFLSVCCHVPILIAIFLFFKKYNILRALINFGLLGQFFWSIDFLSKIIFNKYIFGVTKYIFNYNNYNFFYTTVIMHLFVLIPLLFLIRNYKIDNYEVFLSSIVYAIIIFATSILFTNYTANINYIFYNDFLLFIKYPIYQILYIPVVIVFMIIPTQILQNIIQNKKKIK